MILCLETSTPVCSAALVTRDGIAGELKSDESRSHASVLTVFIKELLERNNITAGELDAVAVSRGPGSYTGLRIGVSAAKGLAFGAALPLIAVSTPLLMLLGLKKRNPELLTHSEKTVFSPMTDARRMEVYTCRFDATGKLIKDITAEIITPGTFSDLSEEVPVVLFGSGAAKCEGVVNRPNTVIVNNFTPLASDMAAAAWNAFDNREFEDLAYFEPLYLKDFIATVPRKNIMA